MAWDCCDITQYGRARTHKHTHTHNVSKSGAAELCFLFCAEVSLQFCYINECSIDCSTLFELLG